MTLRAVFFDMGGTIETYGWTPELRIQQTAGVQQRLLDAGIVLGLTDKQLYEIISAGLDAYHQVSLQTMDELPPQRVWNEYIFAGYPVDREKLAAIAEDLMFFIETHYFQRAMRPEVPGVLEAIRKMGLKIGLISNVNSRGQVAENLKQYGIRNYFDPIVLSSEYGRRKPDPAIFHYAARLANVPTGECAYIGDRISRDILGARKAGYRLAVQIRHDYDHGEVDEGAIPDAVIDQMTEFLEILQTELNNSTDSAPGNKSQNKIRALLFDAGDILYHRPNGGRRLHVFLNELGIADKKIPEAKKKELRDQAFQGSISQSQYREAILHLYGVTKPELVARGSQAMEEDEKGIEFFNGVRETLKALKEKGYMLGIVTDTANPIHVKLSWFERGGFGHVWDSIISSQEIGVEKPDPRIYAAALQQLGLSAQQAVFVGHSPEELDGAHAIGMKTIAFNYGETAKADFYIGNFADLLSVPVISSNNDHK
ncbi:MAG: HAD family hydrolase [Chloroflexi bacterium]|nr:HAD family hydrolase [Chloroflexota bacterium]